ncbi:N-6 DNA methylase [Ralstonia pseudosolanacearum]|uniref:N-6 DNA methylase n=1 Tax=Ralstonia pseudosolanacearum TaxID=1310165 RepID=UPI003CF02977
MVGIVSNRASRSIKAIAGELDDGYRHRPGEMLRFMLSEIMVLWGFKPWMSVPEDVRSKVTNAISAYDAAIAAEEPFLDILGPLYQELASLGGKQILGQFFTPWSVASMMSRMLELSGPKASPSRLLAACDPACGSGVMMLAAASAILELHGPRGLLKWSFCGCDLDPICARMMAIQFLANCASHRLEVGEVIVFCGDSLRVDLKKQLIAHASAPGLAVSSAGSPHRQEMIADAAKSSGLQPEQV